MGRSLSCGTRQLERHIGMKGGCIQIPRRNFVPRAGGGWEVGEAGELMEK